MISAPLGRFFLWVIGISAPFYVLGAFGFRLPGFPILPLGALMAFVPMLAALIVVYRTQGTDGTKAFLKSARDLRDYQGARWYIAAVLFMPAVSVVEFCTLRLTGVAIPNPQFAPGETLVAFGLFLIGAIGEEVGWQGFAYPRLRDHVSPLQAAVALGAVWALWHVVPFMQLGRSVDWIFWHSLNAVAMRIIIVWMFENTRHSVLVAVLFHMMLNVSWALFPVSGSYYHPFVTFVILAAAVGLIIAFGGLGRRVPRLARAIHHAAAERGDVYV